MGNQAGEAGRVEQGAGGKASPSFELQALAQIIRDDVRRVGDGDNWTTQSERTQLIGEHAQQFDRAAEQVKARLSGPARLSDGHDDERSVCAFRMQAGVHGHGPVHEADTVRDIERLCLRLFGADVHQDDLLADACACQRVSAVAADMARAENDDLLVFHGRFLQMRVNKRVYVPFASPEMCGVFQGSASGHKVLGKTEITKRP